ncbi:hypothetical protein Mucpa_2019 [Mucilaginibacter paludis DSM 18603]|uniref:Glycosaminoglycan attachment site n=2 Tax=Mucilaginibacter TaxID=423349 RepID=H1YE96_9SPHI|nr:hypothetical protein Mucpa_2019 [Mucilaginibacter paludis DSM 18603]
MDLFTPMVEQNKLHHNFVMTVAPHALGVRKVISDWANGFVDRDGKFIKEFQTTYNSSFWELYLYAVMKHFKLDVDFSFASPDFVIKNRNLIIEAISANHAHDDVPEWEKTIPGITEGNSFDVFKHSAIRLSNAFSAKVNKYRTNYAQLNHVKDRPYIIAISNFSRQDFNLHGDVPLQWLLYDVLEQKSLTKSNDSTVDLGLFRSNAFQDISAVLYSSLATFGKARVLGDDTGDITCHAIRIKNNYEILKIQANISEYKETLTDGLRLFVNPFAKNPINIDDFVNGDIRIFIADKNGDLTVSCHEDGDLCMRFIDSKFPKHMLK